MRQPARAGECVLIGHGNNLVKNGAIQDIRDGPDADSWNLVTPSRAAGKHRSVGRFHGDNADTWLAFFKNLAYAGDCSACAHCGNETIHRATGIFPDLYSRRLSVDLRISRIPELI